MTASLTLPARSRTPDRRARRLVDKLPIGMMIAAALITIGAFVTRPDSPPGAVAQAIDAPFHDVGILPLEDSVAFWQARVDANPTDYLSRTRLGTSLIAQAKETGDLSLYATAEAVLLESLELNPIDDTTLLALGAARAANHDFSSSLDLANQVLARHPDSQAAQIAIADDNFELGNYATAARQLDQLMLTLPEGVGVDSRLAKRAAVEGRLDDAIRYSAAAVIASSDLDLRASEAAFYRFQLGHFLAQAGRLDDALNALDAGLAIDPDHVASLEAKAGVLVSLGRLEAASDLYEQLIDRGPAADLHGELATIYQVLGRDADADAQIAKGLSIGHEQLGTFPAERRHLAAFFSEFEPATALEAARADFETRQDVGAYDALGWAYYQNGRYEDAARYVDGALAQGTKDAALLYHAGMIERASGNTARAEALLRSALDLNPRFDLVHAPKAAAALEALAR